MYTLKPAKINTNNNTHMHMHMHAFMHVHTCMYRAPPPWTTAWQSNEKWSQVGVTRMLRKQASSLTNKSTCYSHLKKVHTYYHHHHHHNSKRIVENSLNSSQIALIICAISSAYSVFLCHLYLVKSCFYNGLACGLNSSSSISFWITLY